MMPDDQQGKKEIQDNIVETQQLHHGSFTSHPKGEWGISDS